MTPHTLSACCIPAGPKPVPPSYPSHSFHSTARLVLRLLQTWCNRSSVPHPSLPTSQPPMACPNQGAYAQTPCPLSDTR
ncbi:hypothetical protein ARMGADRAFT_1021279 [Armillaria gallica]|uniref:Uncharacterized protein n=1 Tax=Armillaria gallica TaxID=47427 RepID=A0A2H3CUR5_ARMGA|nr:hypothetical protein ARMGADRAFT_1021279 [Armillaria gallica]